MKLYVELSYDEIQKELPYLLIAETTSRAIWDTGKRKRLMKQTFTDQEREGIRRIRQQAHLWALCTGVPKDGVKMTVNTYQLWGKLGVFCASL